MPPESSFGMRALESLESHHRKRMRGFFLANVFGDATCEQAEFGVLLHGQPGQQRKTLEDHRNVGVRTFERRALPQNTAAAGSNQSGENAQKSAFAGSAAAFQAAPSQLSAGRDGEADFLEHGLLRAARGKRERFGDLLGANERWAIFHGVYLVPEYTTKL